MALSRRQIDGDAREEVARRDAVVPPAVGSRQIPTHGNELRQREDQDKLRDDTIFSKELHVRPPRRSLNA